MGNKDWVDGRTIVLVIVVVIALTAFAVPSYVLYQKMLNTRKRPPAVKEDMVLRCPPGWVSHLTDRCTKIVQLSESVENPEPAGYSKAEAACRDVGGTLAEVRHERDITALNDGVGSNLSGLPTWVGLRQFVNSPSSSSPLIAHSDLKNDAQQLTMQDETSDWRWTRSGRVFDKNDEFWPMWANNEPNDTLRYSRDNPSSEHCATAFLDSSSSTWRLADCACEKYPDEETGDFPSAYYFGRIENANPKCAPTRALCHTAKRLYKVDDGGTGQPYNEDGGVLEEPKQRWELPKLELIY